MIELIVKLLIVFNPFGCLAAIDALCPRIGFPRRSAIIRRELSIALALMVVFALFGRTLFAHLGIGISALQTAGGSILFILAMRCIFPPPDEFRSSEHERSSPKEPFIIPLAIPQMAGPGMLTNILVAGDVRPAGEICAAVAIVAILSWAIWRSAAHIERLIGSNGVMVVHRFNGFFLVMIAVNMVLTGIREQFFH